MAAFIVSSFGGVVLSLFAGLFTTPSWQPFLILAYGWAVAGGERQTITTYLWLSGATSVKHFSCFYLFLGGALSQARWQVWARILRGAARWVPEGAPIVLSVADATKKKAGRPIEGGALSQRRGLSPPRISSAAGAQLCVGAEAYPRVGLTGPECEYSQRVVALPQSGAGPEAERPVSISQCPGP
jgi:hypothetical protein